MVSPCCICCVQGKTRASGLFSDLLCDLATAELTQGNRFTAMKGLLFIPLGQLQEMVAGNASGHCRHLGQNPQLL